MTNSSTNTVGLAALPTELLREILRHADNPAGLARVTRRLHAIAEEQLYASVYFNSEQSGLSNPAIFSRIRTLLRTLHENPSKGHLIKTLHISLKWGNTAEPYWDGDGGDDDPVRDKALFVKVAAGLGFDHDHPLTLVVTEGLETTTLQHCAWVLLLLYFTPNLTALQLSQNDGVLDSVVTLASRYSHSGGGIITLPPLGLVKTAYVGAPNDHVFSKHIPLQWMMPWLMMPALDEIQVENCTDYAEIDDMDIRRNFRPVELPSGVDRERAYKTSPVLQINLKDCVASTSSLEEILRLPRTLETLFFEPGWNGDVYPRPNQLRSALLHQSVSLKTLAVFGELEEIFTVPFNEGDDSDYEEEEEQEEQEQEEEEEQEQEEEEEQEEEQEPDLLGPLHEFIALETLNVSTGLLQGGTRDSPGLPNMVDLLPTSLKNLMIGCRPGMMRTDELEAQLLPVVARLPNLCRLTVWGEWEDMKSWQVSDFRKLSLACEDKNIAFDTYHKQPEADGCDYEMFYGLLPLSALSP